MNFSYNILRVNFYQCYFSTDAVIRTLPLTIRTQSYQSHIQLILIRSLFHTSTLADKYYYNPISASPTKWSNTLKQFVDNSRRIVLVCLTILWDWRLKY